MRVGWLCTQFTMSNPSKADFCKPEMHFQHVARTVADIVQSGEAEAGAERAADDCSTWPNRIIQKIMDSTFLLAADEGNEQYGSNSQGR